jgi:hypothetical protein
MNGGSGVVTAPAAMRSGANQLELVQFGSQWPGLVAGKLAHICERLAHASPELKFRITGRSSARGNHGDWPALPLTCLADGCSPPPVFDLTVYEPSSNPWGN